MEQSYDVYAFFLFIYIIYNFIRIYESVSAANLFLFGKYQFYRSSEWVID